VGRSPNGVYKRMRNLELKCRCPNLEAARERAERLGARDAGLLRQEDTFFPAPLARLKLRDPGEGPGELIVYHRPDETGIRGSDYLIYPAADPQSLACVLREALGEVGRVVKRRRLLLYQHTRIHLDEVEGLGTFVELETVITDQPEEAARAELERVAAALELENAEPVAEAYVDLLHAVR